MFEILGFVAKIVHQGNGYIVPALLALLICCFFILVWRHHISASKVDKFIEKEKARREAMRDFKLWELERDIKDKGG